MQWPPIGIDEQEAVIRIGRPPRRSFLVEHLNVGP